MLISLLGPMEVRLDDGAPVDVGGAKQRAVLAQLCRTPNVAVSADRLAEGVWGEQVPPRYRQNLQVYVSTLRRLLEPNRPAMAPSRILSRRDAYELTSADDEIDVRCFEVGLRNGREALSAGRPDAAATALREALARWRGEPLVDLVDQPFAARWITELDRQRTDALSERIRADLALGRSAELLPELSDLVERFPEREAFWEQLMIALYRCGRQTEALEVFRIARERLLEEAGLDPGPALAATAEAILNQDPALLALAPVTSEARSVPVPLTPVIGSADDIATVVALIGAGERLVTMTGPGGVGKTRLALAVALELRAAGREVVWVPLEQVRTAGEAADSVTRAMSVASQSDAASGKHAGLLLLDNLEQIPDVGDLVRTLVQATPALQILATSRSLLGVRGERVVPVQPLDLASAVELFETRAMAVDPTLDLQRWRPDVEQLCQALDRLPLAVELAGARVGLFTPRELADELATDPRSLDLSIGEDRQGSVQRLVAWSLDLVSAQARKLLARLASCPGSVDLETVGAVGATAGLSSTDIPRIVDELVRGALLRSVEGRDRRRFVMLNIVRSVAAAELSTEDRGLVADGLADLWVSRARRASTWVEPDAARLASTRADLAATWWVIDHLLGTGRADDAAAILLADLRALFLVQRTQEALDALLRVLATDDLSDDLRAAVSVGAGAAAYKRHDPRAEELLAAVEQLPATDHANRVVGLTNLCAYRADLGEAEQAELLGKAALAAAVRSGVPRLQAIAHSACEWAALRREAFSDAVHHAREQLRLSGSDEEAALALNDLALAELFQENTGAALEAAAEALTLARRQGAEHPIAVAQQELGYALVQSGDGLNGAAMLVQALRQVRADAESEDTGFLLETAAALGLAACLAGHSDGGQRLIRRANAAADQEYPGELAVTEPLRPVARAHAIEIAEGPKVPGRLPTVIEIVDEAIALGTLMSGVDRSKPVST